MRKLFLAMLVVALVLLAPDALAFEGYSFIRMGGPDWANVQQLVMGDDICLSFGVDEDFCLKYDETTDNRLELSDGDNDFLRVVDDGTTATFTFLGGAVFNEGGADVNFRFESDDNANMLVIDGGLNSIGVGTTAVGRTQLKTGGSFTGDGSGTTIYAFEVDTDLTAVDGDTNFQVGARLGATVTTQNNSETIAHVTQLLISEPNITEGNDTITTASSVWITGAPDEGASNYALFVDAGATRLDGDLRVNDGAGLTVGGLGQQSVGSISAEFQVVGTGADDSAATLARFSNDANSPSIRTYKSQSGTVGGTGIITTGADLFVISAYGDDGVDNDTLAAQILFDSEGTIGAGAIPGVIKLCTAAAGTCALGLEVGSDQHVTLSEQLALSVNAGVTATNPGGQGDSPQTKDIVEVSTVGTADDAITLPSAEAGMCVKIINNGANQLEIFPASNDNAGAGADTAVNLASGSNVEYCAYDATNWEAF